MQKIGSWIIAVVGLWEVIAAFSLGYPAGGIWEAVIVGVLLICFGVWAAVSKKPGTNKVLDWINAVIGVWMIVAPFVIGYSSVAAALWNDIIVGVVTATCGVWAAIVTSRKPQ